MPKLLTLLLCLFTMTLCAQSTTTHTYYDDLQLDLYHAPEADEAVLMIFVHGGGFAQGDRRSGKAFCTYLAQRGINCASISYTLSMHGRSDDWSCNGKLAAKLRTLQLAGNETWAATQYLTGSESPLPSTPQHVFLAGSSAGAEAVLAAAFYDRSSQRLIDHGLDPSFKYAGIISGAGAMVDLNLIPSDKPTPLLLLHGTDDPIVPYGTAAHHYCQPSDPGWLMLFGGGALADHYDKIGGNYHLIEHRGAGHEIAGRYFYEDQQRITDFVRAVRSGPGFQARVSIEEE